MAEVVVVDVMTRSEAVELTRRIRERIEIVWSDIAEAYQRGAWQAMGYESWDAYTDAEFGTSRLRLPREQRQEVVASLSSHGMSSRAIATVAGVHHGTVLRDRRSGGAFAPPDGSLARSEVTPRFGGKVKGLDGKMYPQETAFPKRAASFAERREAIQRLHDRGYRLSQIAAELGIAVNTVREHLTALGLSSWDAQLRPGAGAVPRLNETAAGIVAAAEPSHVAVDMLRDHYHELDRERLADWVSSLETSIKLLNTVKNAMRRELTHDRS